VDLDLGFKVIAGFMVTLIIMVVIMVKLTIMALQNLILLPFSFQIGNLQPNFHFYHKQDKLLMLNV